MAGLYLHIPFCSSKCPYCSFVSYAGLKQVMPRYVQAVKMEMATQASHAVAAPIETVFIGGGTPTVLPPELLLDLWSAVRSNFSIAEAAEISIEANPGTITREGLLSLRQTGFNRISLGIQSLTDGELSVLGRSYASDTARQAIETARKAGFDNLSLDLIYGVPGQTGATWKRTLEEALGCEPTHLSCYQLTIEDNTLFSTMLDTGVLDLPAEEEIENMDELTVALCQAAGLRHYEISNYAQVGRECRHNINYWRNGDYYAFGAGAVSCISGRRQRRIEDPVAYCRMVETYTSPVVEEEQLDREASFRESVVIGLRMVEGVCRADLVARYGMDVQDYYGELLDQLRDSGLLELSPVHLRLSENGRRVANRVLSELV